MLECERKERSRRRCLRVAGLRRRVIRVRGHVQVAELVLEERIDDRVLELGDVHDERERVCSVHLFADALHEFLADQLFREEPETLGVGVDRAERIFCRRDAGAIRHGLPAAVAVDRDDEDAHLLEPREVVRTEDRCIGADAAVDREREASDVLVRAEKDHELSVRAHDQVRHDAGLVARVLGDVLARDAFRRKVLVVLRSGREQVIAVAQEVIHGRGVQFSVSVGERVHLTVGAHLADHAAREDHVRVLEIAAGVDDRLRELEEPGDVQPRVCPFRDHDDDLLAALGVFADGLHALRVQIAVREGRHDLLPERETIPVIGRDTIEVRPHGLTKCDVHLGLRLLLPA